MAPYLVEDYISPCTCNWRFHRRSASSIHSQSLTEESEAREKLVKPDAIK